MTEPRFTVDAAGTATDTHVVTTAEMRAWLRENVDTTGIEVGERGFLSQAARDAYVAAHAGTVQYPDGSTSTGYVDDRAGQPAA